MPIFSPALKTALMASLFTLSLNACTGISTTPISDNLAAFPPMANDAPPGAAADTLAIAQALGRGVNFGNMLESPTEGSWGVTVNDTIYDDFIAKTVAAGFKTVRLPVRFSNHAALTADAKIDAAFLNHVESLVDKMLGQGLYVILDLHHYRQFDGDNLDNGEVEVDANVLDVRFLNLWSQLGTRFSAKSDHLLFELYNEAHGRLTPDKWNDMAARALAVVRKDNPTRAVLLGPTQWNSAWGLSSLKVPNDSHVIVTVHNYDPFTFTHQGADWISPVLPLGVTCCDTSQQNAITAPLDIAQNWSASHHYPIHLGEFGAFGLGDTNSRVAYSRFIRNAAEARGFSWTYWEFASGFGVYDPIAKTFRTSLLDSLMGN